MPVDSSIPLSVKPLQLPNPLETAGQGITCNAICPGYVLTPLVEAQIPDQMKAHGMDRETVIREVMLLRQPSRQFQELCLYVGMSMGQRLHRLR